MNKLGFYTKNFGAPGVIQGLKDIKPPVLLTELDDFSVLENTRNEWSPETFIIGRFYYNHPEQGAMLDNPDPEAMGRKLAERCLTENFSFGKRRGNNGRLFIDAWMSLNEVVRGPNSFPQNPAEWNPQHQQDFEKMERQAAAYDAIQVAFLKRLQEEGLEAVAFNFAAGNWIKGEDYIKYFPKTLEAYTYLGFHEYGWPHMNRAESGTKSGCGFYRDAMGPIRQKYGDQHRVIITEAGLARMYKHSTDAAGDVGWLYPPDPVSEDSYKSSLRWYNHLLCSDPYVIGACLFQVGPGHDWESFRHTGEDNQGNRLSLLNELRAMAQEPAPVTLPVAPRPADRTGDLPQPSDEEVIAAIQVAGTPLIMPLNRKAKFYKMAQEQGLGERLTDEFEVMVGGWNYMAQIFEAGLVYAPAGRWDETQAVPIPATREIVEPPNIPWTHEITGFHGNRWNYWERFLQNKIPGLTWHIFMDEVARHNPELEADGFVFKPHKIYKMPFVEEQVEARPQTAPATETPPQAKPAVAVAPPSPDFVQANGGRFLIKGNPMRFVGANIRGLVHYGHDPQYFPHAQAPQRITQLQKATEMNARLVRVFLAHKDATPVQIEGRLREVLALVRDHFPNIYLLPALTNLYRDVPFYVQGDERFYTPYLNKEWYSEGYNENYLPFVEHIVNAFKGEPHIFAWEIGNELKAEQEPRLFVDFMTGMAAKIKSWDSNHMVTTGMISTRHAWMGDKPDLRRELYSSPNIDFITIHAYNGNEHPPEIEDDSDLATEFTKPFIIEEAGFNLDMYHNRPEKTRGDMANWFRKGTSCYMPWGFVATDNDNNDGDEKVGMTGPIHTDWDQLFELHKQCGQLLLGSNGNLEELGNQIAAINFMPQRAIEEVPPWPLLADGFDFPVGKPDGLAYYVAAKLVDQSYYNELGFWHTGEDWNSRKGGDSDLGDPVYAVANGRVVTAQHFPVWGNIVLIEHRLVSGQTVWSQYAHLQKRFVQRDDVVRRGEQIGTIGKGDQDRFIAHLHFEIRLKQLPASKWGWKAPEDRERVLQAYAHPTNFINSYRSK